MSEATDAGTINQGSARSGWAWWLAAVAVIAPVQLPALFFIGLAYLNPTTLPAGVILVCFVGLVAFALGWVGPIKAWQALRTGRKTEAWRWLRCSLAADLVLLGASSPYIYMTVVRPVQF
ncbi:hypothetical protein [uncultured Sphingomonas sp.]|uniref:hypothetical protein n=1 Tax=uncultured Sphingomonas sp. TaxID=158754 RepID=UPI0035CA0A74